MEDMLVVLFVADVSFALFLFLGGIVVCRVSCEVVDGGEKVLGSSSSSTPRTSQNRTLERASSLGTKTLGKR